MASVVIPARNAEPFLADAVDSALAQTLREIEVVVVDDGSTDGTWPLLQRIAERDRRVRPLRRARSGGASAARNLGIAEARGRWIALLDADDLYLSGRLARLIGQAEALGIEMMADDLLKQDFDTGDSLGLCFGAALESRRAISAVELLEGDRPDAGERSFAKPGFLQPVIRRDFLRARGIRYAEDIGAGEDLLLYFECVLRGARFHLLPEAHYVYRLRPGSLSHGSGAPLQLSRANRRMLRLARQAGDTALVRAAQKRQRLLDFNSFVLAAQRGQVGTALRHAAFTDPSLLLREVRVGLGLLRRRLGRRGTRPPSAPSGSDSGGSPTKGKTRMQVAGTRT